VYAAVVLTVLKVFLFSHGPPTIAAGCGEVEVDAWSTPVCTLGPQAQVSVVVRMPPC